MTRKAEAYLTEAVARRKAEKAKDEERLRRYCDGTRTVQEVANLMGWKRDMAYQRIRALGLPFKKTVANAL